jgi:Xaa-Pro aminopeptidase
MISEEKRERLFGFLREGGHDFALIFDREDSRNENVAYLTGHPGDAAVLVSASGRVFLFPRDMKLAGLRARGAEVVDVHGRPGGIRGAVRDEIRRLAGAGAPAAVFPSSTPYFAVRSFEEDFPGMRVTAHPGALDAFLDELRATKSPEEIAILDRGFAIADEVVARMPRWLEENRKKNPREIDLGLHLQREMLDRGTDGARQAMLVANADRSAEVHQDPQAGNGPLFKPGLGLVDFWMVYEGYYTDLTIPILFEPLTREQEEIAEFVLGVYRDTIAGMVTGASIATLSAAAMGAFEQKGLRPVGGLGHGLGMCGHDAPHFSGPPTDPAARKHWKDRKLEEGMVIAVEPGVIHDVHGGYRLENDVVVGPRRAEVRTHAAPLRVKADGRVVREAV